MVESIFILILCLILVSLPSWLLLGLIIPVCIILESSKILPELFKIGETNFYISTLFILITIIKTYFFSRHSLNLHKVHLASLTFLAILFMTTTAAYMGFGEDIFNKEIIPLLRLTVDFSVIFLLAHAIERESQIQWAIKTIDVLGYALAVNIYLEIFSCFSGIDIGIYNKIHYQGDVYRFFGIIGDQVGYILLFFYIYKILKGNYIGAIFFLGAIIATGTRAAFVGIMVSIIFLIYFTDISHKYFEKLRLPVISLILIIIVFFFLDIGGIKTRLSASEEFERSYIQRTISMNLAWNIVLDNPLIGVGYNGFHLITKNYDAEGQFMYEHGSYRENFDANAQNQFLQVAVDGGILALAVFFWMMAVFLRSLRVAATYANVEQKAFFLAGFIWLLSLLLGVQTACWILPASLVFYLLLLILGLGGALLTLQVSSVSRGTPKLLEVSWRQMIAPQHSFIKGKWLPKVPLANE